MTKSVSLRSLNLLIYSTLILCSICVYLYYHHQTSFGRTRDFYSRLVEEPCSFSKTSFSSIEVESESNSSFQRVIDAEELFFVYTAYVAMTLKRRYVLIIAIGRIQTNPQLTCSYFGPDNILYHSEISEVVRMRDDAGHNFYYSSCFILCTTPEGMNSPKFVSISSPKYNDTARAISCRFSNMLKVTQHPLRIQNSSTDLDDPLYPYPIEFAACIKPVYNYNDTLALIEWIEFHKVMGVKHFTIYNLSMARETVCAITSAYSQDELLIVDWKPPFGRQILENAIMAGMNDCLYRYTGIARYVLFTDLDEFIVPKDNWNYVEMLDSIQKGTGVPSSSIAGYRFTNGFFFKCFPDDIPDFVQNEKEPLLRSVMGNMVLARKNRLRYPLYHPYYMEYANRTKVIVRTELAIEIGNHLLVAGIPGTLLLEVDPDIALMHHYRVYPYGCPNVSTIEENSAHKHVKMVANNILIILKNISHSCGGPLFN